MRTLALVMARGGSKGVPGKNMRVLAGKPLVVHTIEEARKCRLLDRIIISTDSAEIAETARMSGAEVPFLRPQELAGDASPVIDATIHALNWLANEGYDPEYSMLLQPTSPLRTSEDMEHVIKLASDKNADAVVSVCPSTHHPYLARKIDSSGKLSNLIDTPLAGARRQDLPESFSLNGAVYLVKTKVLCEKRSWNLPGAYAYVMPQERSFDIDSEWDLQVVDFLLSQIKGDQK